MIQKHATSGPEIVVDKSPDFCEICGGHWSHSSTCPKYGEYYVLKKSEPEKWPEEVDGFANTIWRVRDKKEKPNVATDRQLATGHWMTPWNL